MPNRMHANASTECASVEIASLTPACFAAWMCMSFKSRRSGLGVDFQIAPKRTRRGDHALHVDVVRLALADQAPRGMRDDGDVRIVHGTDHALGLRLARQIEIRVYGGHDDVELGQALSGRSSLPSLRISSSMPLRIVKTVQIARSAGRSRGSAVSAAPDPDRAPWQRDGYDP